MKSQEIVRKFNGLYKMINLEVLRVQKRYQPVLDQLVAEVINDWHVQYPNHEFKLSWSDWSGTHLRWKRKSRKYWRDEYDLAVDRKVHNELRKQFEEILRGYRRMDSTIEFEELMTKQKAQGELHNG